MIRSGNYSMCARIVSVFLFCLILFPAAVSAQTTHSIDVYLELPAEIAPVPSLAGYEVKLALSPVDLRLVLFNAIQTDAYGSHPPIFPLGNPYVYPNGGDTIIVSDYLMSGSEEIKDGRGLFRAQFQVESGLVGSFDVIVEQMWTNLADDLGNPIPYIATNGTIDILSSGAVATTPAYLTIVPEPGMLVLLTLGGLTLIRRRRA